jgi:hypothetical protein
MGTFFAILLSSTVTAADHMQSVPGMFAVTPISSTFDDGTVLCGLRFVGGDSATNGATIAIDASINVMSNGRAIIKALATPGYGADNLYGFYFEVDGKRSWQTYPMTPNDPKGVMYMSMDESAWSFFFDVVSQVNESSHYLMKEKESPPKIRLAVNFERDDNMYIGITGPSLWISLLTGDTSSPQEFSACLTKLEEAAK